MAAAVLEQGLDELVPLAGGDDELAHEQGLRGRPAVGPLDCDGVRDQLVDCFKLNGSLIRSIAACSGFASGGMALSCAHGAELRMAPSDPNDNIGLNDNIGHRSAKVPRSYPPAEQLVPCRAAVQELP